MKLFIDCETTGLPKSRVAHYSQVELWPRIVSLAWCLVDSTREVLSNGYHIVKPDGFTIPLGAARVHGITTEIALAKGILLKEVLGDFLSDLSEYGPEVLIAHNADFDVPVVLSELTRLGVNHRVNDLPVICTMKASTNYCKLPGHKGYKWPKLIELYRTLFGTTFEGAHDANADLFACVKCFHELDMLGLIPTGTRDYSVSIPSSGYSSSTSDDFNDDDNSEAQELIERILDWATSNPHFNTDFVEKLENDLEARGRLSQKQIEALENIADRWEID